MITIWKTLFISAVAFLVNEERSLGATTNSYAGGSTNALVIRFEYVGPHTRGWLQVCLANEAGTNELTTWLNDHRFLEPTFRGAIITDEEATRLRLMLDQPGFSKRRTKTSGTEPE